MAFVCILKFYNYRIMSGWQCYSYTSKIRSIPLYLQAIRELFGE